MTTQVTREETKPKDEVVYKYSNKGLGQLREAVIIEGKPYFMKYFCDEEKDKRFIQVEPKIMDVTPVLRPPIREEYPYNPYEFATVEEPQRYLQRALNETPDSLLAKIKTLVKQFNVISDKTVTLLSTNIFGSYFQDRDSTLHYLIIVGANGTGKSAFGETFECLGYRPVNATNTTEAFWYRVFGTIEYGQVTIVSEEFDKMDENGQVMAMLKVGYQPNARVPRMNNDNSKMEFFYPFCFKIMISEKSPNEDMARGVLDRSFKIKTYKGFPALNIKEIRNPQGNAKRQRLLDEINDLRKLLLAYRILHIKDPYKEIDIGLNGRDEELCKPLLQLFYTLDATEETRTEIEKTLQYFLDIKNDRKGDSLEGSIYPIVKNAVSRGEDHISLSDDDIGKRLKSISATDLWQQITNELEGDFKRDNNGDVIEPNTFLSADFGRQYRSRVIAIIRDKFGAEKDHRHKGNNLIFDLDRLEEMYKIYKDDGKIKTRPIGDSLTHSGPDTLRASPSESHTDQCDSPSTISGIGGLSESVNHLERENNDSPKEEKTKTDQVKCPYCDYEDHPFFLKIHRKNAHEGGL